MIHSSSVSSSTHDLVGDAGASTDQAKAPLRVVASLAFAQFGLFVALLAPVLVSMTVKASEISPTDPQGVLAVVLPIGAIAAFLAGPFFGRRSDRTLSRFGRRRPWLLVGLAGFVGGLALVALSPDIVTLTITWALTQISANIILAALFGTVSDQVPESQRGKVSAIVAVSQNVGILAAVYAASFLTGGMFWLFLGPALVTVVAVTVYVFVLPDRPITEKPELGGFGDFVSTFWVNPVKHPDFAWAWWSRALIMMANFIFTTYRLLYLKDHIGMAIIEAVQALAFGVLLYTIALVISAQVSGWISDRIHRRKVFVFVSTVLFAVGLVMLAQSNSLEAFYLAEVVLGLGYGTYTAVDTALVLDVLPSKANAGKDLAVMNIANALPQSLAPVAGIILLNISGPGNYVALCWGAGLVAFVGAFAVLPIKKVR